eukprot:Phypoly_transcript_15990.p1 GENE.Phypoly_transcript_15990~~Phypoly_transcript_15990.p1  ORF type:complete len:246 (+),score=23.40 Phypoly_transcript_15990:85-822(+)
MIHHDSFASKTMLEITKMIPDPLFLATFLLHAEYGFRNTAMACAVFSPEILLELMETRAHREVHFMDCLEALFQNGWSLNPLFFPVCIKNLRTVFPKLTNEMLEQYYLYHKPDLVAKIGTIQKSRCFLFYFSSKEVKYGAKYMSIVLNEDSLFIPWQKELLEMPHNSMAKNKVIECFQPYIDEKRGVELISTIFRSTKHPVLRKQCLEALEEYESAISLVLELKKEYKQNIAQDGTKNENKCSVS